MKLGEPGFTYQPLPSSLVVSLQLIEQGADGVEDISISEIEPNRRKVDRDFLPRNTHYLLIFLLDIPKDRITEVDS